MFITETPEENLVRSGRSRSVSSQQTELTKKLFIKLLKFENN